MDKSLRIVVAEITDQLYHMSSVPNECQMGLVGKDPLGIDEIDQVPLEFGKIENWRIGVNRIYQAFEICPDGQACPDSILDCFVKFGPIACLEDTCLLYTSDAADE